jgi:serine/threonine protein kinase
MAVRLIRFSEPVNASEQVAQSRIKAALESLGDTGLWVVYAGLASSSSPVYQSDDIDLLAIGPRGVLCIEVKHWDASWVNNNSAIVDAEAEKVTSKARRLAGRVRRALPNGPRVEQRLLLTREPVGPSLPKSVRGVPLWTLRDLAKELRECEQGILTEPEVKALAASLEPAAKLHVDGKVRRLGSYQNLELATPHDQAFHRIYKGVHRRTKERVILHVYDLSASDEKNPERLAERESRVLQMLQTTPFVPRVRETLRELPEFPGELHYFSLIDPGAPNLLVRLDDPSWNTKERVEFAANACSGLAALHALRDADEVSVVHRALCPESILVAARNEPMFINFDLSRLSNTQTLGISDSVNTAFDAPEVRADGLGAASHFSDVYSLCSSLMALFAKDDSALAKDASAVLRAGCLGVPAERAPLEELSAALLALLSGPTKTPAQFAAPSEDQIPPCEYWAEGQLVPFRDMTLRVVSRLGSGGVGRTFKVEQVDPSSGENFGTYVAKVMKSQESGRAALQSYQRVRSHTVSPGLSVVFETAAGWREDRVVALLKWIEGDSLDGLAGVLALAAEESGDESVEQMLLRLLKDVMGALHALHSRSLVHGDVSPRNLIFDRGGLTLTDYDLVTQVGKSAWGVGATNYCSPEAQRREPLVPSDDLFALAASLFEIAFDHPPFASPHGAVDKSAGLDWRAGERETLPSLAAFLDRATAADRSQRFQDARSALLALPLSVEVELEVPEVSEDTPATRSPQRVAWLTSLLSTYPGAPHGNIETRGLDSDFALATYVETPLEQALFDAVLSRSTKLVILCGNAGDGKTAVLQHVAGKFGIERHRSASRVWEATTADGLTLRANLDGSASWQGKSANELLDEFLEPFAQGAPAADVAHFVAINDGRLFEWLESHEKRTGTSTFTRALRAFLAQDGESGEALPHVKFINLNHRALVGGRLATGEWSDDFLDRLLNLLLGGGRANEVWSPCTRCDAWNRCTAGPNAHRLLADASTAEGILGRRLRARLSTALQAVHQRGQVHITTRELRGVLSYVVFGIRSCDDLHADAGLIAEPHWDMLFAPDTPFRQGDLLPELSALDPGLESHPQLDRWLIGRTAREIGGAGPTYAGLRRESARRRAFLEWSEEQIDAVTADSAALPLANGAHLRLFRDASLRSAAENVELSMRLCRGISQLESLPALAAARGSIVPLRITPRTPTETFFWVEKPLDRFILEAEWPRTHDVPLPTLPRRLRLVYKAVAGADDELAMGYELFHTLLCLAEGEQLSALRSDDLFANLSIFTQRLAKEDEGHLLAWNPKADATVHRLNISRATTRQVLVCETAEGPIS